MAKISSKIKVGCYRLGWRYIELWVRTDNCGGRVVTGPAPENKITVMTIGIDQSWPDVVDVLLHEAFEIAAWDEGCQYQRSGLYAQTTNSYFFSFTHDQFQEINAKAGYFLAKTLPEVCTVYKRVKKLTRKKK